MANIQQERERLKSIISQFEPKDLLSKLYNLRKVRYKFKDSDQIRIGLIAQDLQKDFPELVSGKDYLTVDYAKVNILAMKAIEIIDKLLTNDNN